MRDEQCLQQQAKKVMPSPAGAASSGSGSGLLVQLQVIGIPSVLQAASSTILQLDPLSGMMTEGRESSGSGKVEQASKLMLVDPDEALAELARDPAFSQ